MTDQNLIPRLIVSGATEALDFYTEVLGGQELVRYPEPSGRIVHAEVKIGTTVFSVTEADSPLSFTARSEWVAGAFDVSGP